MPDISRYKSIAVPIPIWEILIEMSKVNHRSPAQQVSFLVEEAKGTPTDKQVRKWYAALRKKK
jgi:hypothetical protein